MTTRTTPEQRRQALMARSRENRARANAIRMDRARTPGERLIVACEYLRSMATRLESSAEVDAWARAVTEIADGKRSVS